MFAVAALVAFLLALVLQLAGAGDHVGRLDLVVLGLVFVAAHLAFGWPLWRRRA